jgi:hypothetical protein
MWSLGISCCRTFDAQPPAALLDRRLQISSCGISRMGKAAISRDELFFEVVSYAYEQTSLLVTSNLPVEAWTEVLGSERLTGVLLNRLTHWIRTIAVNGESSCLRKSSRPHPRSSSQGSKAKNRERLISPEWETSISRTLQSSPAARRTIELTSASGCVSAGTYQSWVDRRTEDTQKHNRISRG